MARVARPDLVHLAICSGIMGQIEWKPAAADNLREDRRMDGFTTIGVRDLLRQWVLKNGAACINAKQETDPDWLARYPDDPWWYSVVIEVDEFPKGLFVKVKLVDPDDESDPWVTIVSCHPSLA
jgi:hypothetical protein